MHPIAFGGFASGFTLIEFIVVISIFAITSAILIPFITKPFLAYEAMRARAELAQRGQVVLMQMERDLTSAEAGQWRVSSTLDGFIIEQVMPVHALSAAASNKVMRLVCDAKQQALTRIVKTRPTQASAGPATARATREPIANGVARCAVEQMVIGAAQSLLSIELLLHHAEQSLHLWQTVVVKTAP